MQRSILSRMGQLASRAYQQHLQQQQQLQPLILRAAASSSSTTRITNPLKQRQNVQSSAAAHQAQQTNSTSSTATPEETTAVDDHTGHHAPNNTTAVMPRNYQEANDQVQADIRLMFREVHAELESQLYDRDLDLNDMSKYYFDGKGKAVRPTIVMTLAYAFNHHLLKNNDEKTIRHQRQVAIISEMIHTASLVHDDVLDHAETRRGKPSINANWDIKKSAICGDYILAVGSKIMARIRNEEVIVVLSKILTDLVHGEFQQLQNKEDGSERFQLYLTKTFNKTASLIAYSCKANAVLAGATPELLNSAFEYGRNVGIAFQLVDDLLDFVSSSELLGKPAAADLQLGLATAPVLFASERYPELEPMITRRFSRPGDVEAAFDAVLNSDGLQRTRELAQNHCDEAVKSIQHLVDSPYKDALIVITEKILNRMN